MVGAELWTLRLLSLLLFALAGALLVQWASRCGVRGPRLLAVAVGYLVLPYNAVLGQLVMSEAAFILGCVGLAMIFATAHRSEDPRIGRVLGPIAFGLLTAVLLHLRIHVVAFAAAACLLSWRRDRRRSWPWWAACVVAGLARIPLMIRWGGLVSPAYQDAHGLGFSPEALTYLAAAFIPLLGIYLWPVLTEQRLRGGRRLVWIGAGVGLALGVLATPSLSQELPLERIVPKRFLGITGTAVRMATGSETVQGALLAGLAALGLGSMGAFGAVLEERGRADMTASVARLTLLTLVSGWAMYGLTRSCVFDRYLLPWAALMPIVWAATLRPRLLVVQLAGLTAIAAWQVGRWLVGAG